MTKPTNRHHEAANYHLQRLADQIGEALDVDPVVTLAQLALADDALDAARRQLVLAARELGVTWARIATALGVSRQAAHERYGRSDELGTPPLF